MIEPERVPDEKSNSDAAPVNGAASPAGEPEAVPWRAPRWLLLAVPVVLVLVLLGIRALLTGDSDMNAEERDLPTAEQVESAEQSAEEVLTTWARPDLDYDAWWQALEPLLTPRAREGYAFTDPRRIPDLEVDGDPQVTAGPTTDTVTIGFPTGQGTFAVALYRSGEDAPWRASQIVFPGQKSPFDE
ncbi:MAG: hypothetical protein L0H93_11455 [Nocardioides sp.]|nr:hypothetical protein [Nocardioides sp.]